MKPTTQGTETMANAFNEITLSVFAFNAGKTYSAAQNIVGNKFYGSFNVADAIGFARNSLEWESAHLGAMLHIGALDVWTDANGIMIDPTA